jgi:tRNA modification GTPase
VASLDQAEASLLRQDSPELTALDLREAMEALGELTGKIDTEDILGAIFSTFCIGK